MTEVTSSTAAMHSPEGFLQSFASVKPDPAALEAHGIVGFDKHDLRSRPFSLMRTQIAKRIASHNLRLIGITSPTPGAGKSFMALNLAGAMARISEQPILLADLDLRKASVASALGIAPQFGIADFLSGKTDTLESMGWHIEGANLDVLPTRVYQGESAGLLNGKLFDDLINSLRYETGETLVFVDLPPVFAGDDTMITMQKLDGYLMIVDAGRTTKRQLQDAINFLRPTPCIGTILNRYKGGVMDNYGYTYGAYGKEYGKETER